MGKFNFNDSRMAKFFSSKINRDYLQTYINKEGILRSNYDWYLTQGTIATDVTPTDNKGLATFSVKSRELKAATLMNLRAPLSEGYQKEKGNMNWYTATIPDFAADGFRETATERWYRMKMLGEEFGDDADLVDEYTDKLQDLVDSLNSTMTFMTARLGSTGELDYTNIARGIQAPLHTANIPKNNFKKAGKLEWANENCDILEQMRKSHGFFNLVIMWLQDVAKAMELGEWLDVFGILYEEMYLSRGKASRTGQFFTPQCVSDLMAQVIDTGKECGTVNDCASGSGRLLLAHYISKSRTDHSAGRRFKYVAQDCDPIACKMCACNMMAHGMYGMVICQNTLTMSVPSVVYYINEAKYPFDTPYCSIRAVRNEKA